MFKNQSRMPGNLINYTRDYKQPHNVLDAMKYISCESPHQLALKTTERPKLEDGNVLLLVKYVGICGTDLHAYQGNQPFFSYPRILGHELATEILDTAFPHADLAPGSRVVLIPYVNCQKCVSCRAGKTNCCQNLKVLGVHTDGGMQEIISVPGRLLIPANDLSLEEIAIVEPLSIGAHALRRCQIKNNETIIVMGCGPIGIGIIQLAKYIGAKVIAMDTNDYRLRLAKDKFGADIVVNALQSPLDRILEATEGQLSDAIFDATGNKKAMEGGIDFMMHGGRYVLVGLTNGPLTFHHPAIHAKETTLLCSRNATKEDFEFVIRVLREKKFNTESYITKKVPSQSILTDFDSWSHPDSKDIKVLTRWEAS
jgi:2-desacetyl-2-hydroxyethyl bacteriochlorophyllide A dehydrogenase